MRNLFTFCEITNKYILLLRFFCIFVVDSVINQAMRKFLGIVAITISLLSATRVEAKIAPEERVQLADPFILLHGETYYAYGTHHPRGIEFYTSTDLKKWHYGGVALHRDNSYGTKWFWAPEVYQIEGKFYMYYTAEKRICVATADSPTGPFKQVDNTPMLPNEHTIDNTLFIDDDGTPYLFYVHIKHGFHIKVAELERDYMTIKQNSIAHCIKPKQRWEQVEGRVNEGPSIIKHNGLYFMFYSGNGYKSHNYGIGCAIARNIRGPWRKLPENPIFQSPKELVGVGHGAPFYDKAGKLRYVFHAHNSKDKVHPRYMNITRMAIKRSGKEYYPVISSNYHTPKKAIK